MNGNTLSGCSAGTYSNIGDSVCRECPKGYYCTVDHLPIKCANGTYRADGGGSSAGSCTSCPTGFYAMEGWDHCEPCPRGHECSTHTPLKCLRGQYSYDGETTCTECDSGYLCDVGTDTPTPEGHLCPKGSYCTKNSGTKLTPEVKCPGGKYGVYEGAVASTDCETCPGGYFC